MTQIFILQNHDKLFFGKNKEWVDGYDANSVFKTLYKDEAINQMVEISSKDYKQRVKVVTCEVNEKGLPIIDPDIMPAPLPKVAKPGKGTDDLFTAEIEPEAEIASESVEENDETEDVLEFTTDSDPIENDENKNNQATLL